MLIFRMVWKFGFGELCGELSLHQDFDLFHLVRREKLKTALEQECGVLGDAETAFYFGGGEDLGISGYGFVQGPAEHPDWEFEVV